MLLSSFECPLNVAVIGASGGIGAAFVQALAGDHKVKTLYAFSRSGSNFNDPRIISEHIDICDEGSIQNAAACISAELDVLIIASGVLHGEGFEPEKSMRDLDYEQMDKVFAVNSYGPALLFKHFLPLLPRERRSLAVALSARVGSISDNGIGGWYSYRASKAALNMLIKCFSIEMARKYRQAVIAGLHPGTVDTALSEPFQSNVKPGKLFSPAQSAGYLLKVMDALKPEDSGKCFAWDGQEIAP